MITDYQVLALWKEFRKTKKVGKSALRVGMNRKTAAKYITSQILPSETIRPHQWKTHPDKLAFMWDEAIEFLKESPELEAKSLFEFFIDKYPEKIDHTQLRTFQRRVKDWRIQFGENREIYFDQVTHPGRMAQLDWVVMNSSNITISGQEFNHKLIHFALNHSNVESVSVCRSESILSIKKGLREFLYRVLGAAPKILQVDNSSAATHRPNKNKKERAFNEEYLQILSYYGIEPQKTNIASPNENGVVESQNGHIKNKINQALILRGSRNFINLAEYESFLRQVIERANNKRELKFKEEVNYLGKIPPRPLIEYQEEYVKIRNRSTVCIKKVTYSVPSRLIGSRLKAKVYEDKIELFSGTKCVHSLPRVLGDRGIVINYRHIIHSLVRKPGAFENYKYRDELYPTENFKKAFDFLVDQHSERQATIEYLRILKLAADNLEEDVDTALELVLSDEKGDLSSSYIGELVVPKKISIIDNIILTPDLEIYDRLLSSTGEEKNEIKYH